MAAHQTAVSPATQSAFVPSFNGALGRNRRKLLKRSVRLSKGRRLKAV
jgi:hypothetical protein